MSIGELVRDGWRLGWWETNKLVRAACVRCHGTRCPLLTALFLFLSSEVVTFLPEGVSVGLPNFAWGFKSQRK